MLWCQLGNILYGELELQHFGHHNNKPKFTRKENVQKQVKEGEQTIKCWALSVRVKLDFFRIH